MDKRRRVFLYGKSLILGTVGASLRYYPDLEILSLSPPFPAPQELQALAPDVIIFDLQAAQPEAAFTLLDNIPGLILIGIDPSSEQVFMWTGKHMSAVSASDLAQAIRNNTPPPKMEDHENSNV